MRLDDPELVRREYASEDRLAARSRVFRELVDGPNAEELALEAVGEVSPRRVLEVGCGTGEFARRVQDELGAEVVALDLSPRMVELARARGVDARLGDIQALSFGEGEFDCAVANWVLYHLPDLDHGLAELARVLRPGGRLVAATFGEDNLQELWRALGEERTPPPHSFTAQNGAEPLRRHFGRVERRDARGVVVFPDRAAIRRYVAASIRRRHLAGGVADLDGPFRARSTQAVFVAEK